MKFGVYVIRDALTGFMTPTFDINDESAIRNFSHAVNRSDTILNSSPADYSLCKIGEFDSDTGSIVPELPAVLVTGISVITGTNVKGG